MRKIKFRVWHKTEKRLILFDDYWYCYEYTSLAFQSSQEENHGICAVENKDEAEFEIMQFTGLKDLCGKDIYEGDIVNNDGAKYIVEWGEQEAGFYLFEICSHRTFYFTDNSNEYNVIGNIYQNKELLKNED